MLSIRWVIILFAAILLVVVSLFVLYQQRGADEILNPVVTVQSTPEVEPITTTNEVHSPDGKMSLIIKKVTEGENSTYSFFVSDTPETNRNLIFEKTVPSTSMFDISPNAWSPDNKYFFIKEVNVGSVDYLVFKASGEAFSEGEQYINVVPLFVARGTGYSFSETTGWDSEMLLHVYTTKSDGTKGPSFWFEVPSKAIIQLASR